MSDRQIAPPEQRYAAELAALVAADTGARPPGWRLSPRAVVHFVCGDAPGVEGGVTPKFVGERALVERAVITLAGTRGLLLVGEPGTAKSMLSELLAAAICGTSGLTVQGTAGTTEDQLRYGWNYALLLASGPRREARHRASWGRRRRSRTRGSPKARLTQGSGGCEDGGVRGSFFLSVPEGAVDAGERQVRGWWGAGFIFPIRPTGELVAVAYNGTIDIHDADDGALVGTIDYDESLTMPDWSPDGSTLLAVAGKDLAMDNAFHDSWILAFPHLGEGRFGPPDIVVPPEVGTWFYYPAYSPDGRWVAYNRSREGSYFSSDATLHLVPAGGGTSIELAAINAADGNASWPRWGPIPDDDVLWLAFSSDRSFGTYDTPYPQVWIAAIDTALAEEGLDPSAPPFRMPQQDLGKGNHAPWWSAN
jgi:hypothetical protein